MRIRMVRLAAGPGGVLSPGTEHDLPQAEALAIVASGSAVAMEPPAVRQREARPAPAQEVRHDPDGS